MNEMQFLIVSKGNSSGTVPPRTQSDTDDGAHEVHGTKRERTRASDCTRFPFFPKRHDAHHQRSRVRRNRDQRRRVASPVQPLARPSRPHTPTGCVFLRVPVRHAHAPRALHRSVPSFRNRCGTRTHARTLHSPEDVELVRIAGLVHDVGHGPSHMYESFGGIEGGIGATNIRHWTSANNFDLTTTRGRGHIPWRKTTISRRISSPASTTG